MSETTKSPEDRIHAANFKHPETKRTFLRVIDHMRKLDVSGDDINEIMSRLYHATLDEFEATLNSIDQKGKRF